MTALRGKRVIVTGGSRGIGRAVTGKLLEAGARAAVISRDPASLAACRDDLRSRFGDVPAAAADLSIAGQASAAIGEMASALGGLDIVVCGVGGAMSAPFPETKPEDWERMFALNFYTALHSMRAALPFLLDAGSGKILAIGSTASLSGFPYVAPYCAAKHALLGLTRALAAELARKKITVNLVCPGFTNTDLLRESIAAVSARTGRKETEIAAEFARQNDSGKLLEPEHVASVIMGVLERTDGASGEAIVI